MRSVWSFWSKPFHRWKGRVWQQPLHHMLAWGLSLRLARQHYPETVLITDTPGKRLLVDRLGLEFQYVSTELDRLDDEDEGWWALGKLVAYSLQDRPFVHLDTDCFLWKALSPSVTSAPVFAQCPEIHSVQDEWDRPSRIEELFARHGRSLPVEWEWASSINTTSFREENCGVMGGNDIPFLRHFSQTSIDLVTDPALAALWAELPEKSGFNMIVEQFFLAACVDYHRSHPTSPFRGVGIRYLFDSWGAAFDPGEASRIGFTHLLGDVKSDPAVIVRLERRVATMDPAFHRHCHRVATAKA